MRKSHFRFIQRMHRPSPKISTASMPDIIFMLLFFFMMSTQLRTIDPRLKLNSAQASGLLLIDAAARRVEIWLGKAIEPLGDGSYLLQLGDRVFPVDSLQYILPSYLDAKDLADGRPFSAALRADRGCEMKWINLIKEGLSKNGIKQLYIGAREKSFVR